MKWPAPALGRSPRARSQRVLWDVRNEYISLDNAREAYGVIVDDRAWRVNEDETTALREVLRRQRDWRKAPFIDRGPLPPGA